MIIQSLKTNDFGYKDAVNPVIPQFADANRMTGPAQQVCDIAKVMQAC